MSRKAIFVALLVLFELICGTNRDALASAGCKAVNSGSFNVSTGAYGNRTTVGFAVGDNVTFTITWSMSGSWLLRTATFIELDGSPISAADGSQTRSYTVTGKGPQINCLSGAAGPIATRSLRYGK